MRRMPSWSQKIESRGEFFQQNFALEFFLWGRMSRYPATPLIVASSPGHSDTSRFRPWSPIATGNHLYQVKKIQNLFRRLAPLTILILFQAFRDPLRGELPHVKIFMNDGPNPLTWDAQLLSFDLAEIRRSSKISSWIWSIISGVVTVLGLPGRGATQMEKSSRLNRATQFLTVAYDGAYSHKVSVRMAWISFGTFPCRGEKNLMTVCVSMLLEPCASPDMLPFSLCSKKILAIWHMKRPLFPTTLSIPSNDIGKYVWLRSYQHPLVK